jgi:hypothetical protein
LVLRTTGIADFSINCSWLSCNAAMSFGAGLMPLMSFAL